SQTNVSLLPYFANIKNLLSDINVALRNNSDYSLADKYATSAYLDNFEYIEAPLEKVDPKLMHNLEIMMREQLRESLKKGQQSEAIVLLNNITTNLSTAANLLNINYVNLETNNKLEYSIHLKGNTQLNNLSDIKELSKGFGSYSGIKKGFGESSDSEKTGVRLDID